jgi:glycosyltransferase involved in cell wall biosynthesis
MNVAINCRSFLNKEYTGIGRYTYHLIKSFAELDTENDYLLYAKKGMFSFNKRLPRFHGKNIHLIIDRFNQGIEKTLGKFDIYHSPSPETISVNGGAKIIVTVHDLIFKTFPQGHTQKTVDDTEKQFINIKEKATKIICCSHNTMNDLQKYFNVPSEKIELIHQGVDKNLFYKIGPEEEALAQRTIWNKGVREPYILTVGTIEPRKNLENLLYAFDRLRTRKEFTGKLVVIGMRGWLTDGIEGLIRKLELKNDVIFLGYVTDQELLYFYNKAQAFVFPSFYEGFGFPIVEAFCCGTPVVTSNVSSCPEVAQDAALLADPYNPKDIAEAVTKIVNDSALKKTLTQKGFIRSENFSFKKTAQKTLEVYREVNGLKPLKSHPDLNVSKELINQTR